MRERPPKKFDRQPTPIEADFMRIAFAMINCNRRDGSARAVSEVAERLAKRGHEVHLFARKAEDLDLGLIQWNRVPGPGWPEIADFWTYFHSVNHTLSQHDFDIVHSIGCNTLRANVVTIQNIQPSKQATLAKFHRQERISPFRRFSRHLYLQATSAAEKKLYTRNPAQTPPVFLPVSRGVESELRENYNIGDAPVQIVPNAADTSVFRPVDITQRSAWRTRNRLPESAVLYLFSGGEWRRKGLDLAIRAMGLAARSDLFLFVAGEDPEKESFRKLAAECGITNQVVFGGFQKDIALAMASSDVFLFPSHYEAFSLATIEAAACGLPLLASKINGAEDFIIEGQNGSFIDHDPKNIAKAILRLAENEKTRREMGMRGRQLVEREYTWDRVADLTESAYQMALDLKA